MKVVQTQEFRSGFQLIGEPVIIEKFGTQIGMYLPLNNGQVASKVQAPHLLEVDAPRRGRRPAAVATPREIVRRATATVTEIAPTVKRGRGRPKGSKNKPKVFEQASA